MSEHNPQETLARVSERNPTKLLVMYFYGRHESLELGFSNLNDGDICYLAETLNTLKQIRLSHALNTSQVRKHTAD